MGVVVDIVLLPLTLPARLVALPLRLLRPRKPYTVAEAFAATSISRAGTNAVQARMRCGMVKEPIGAAVIAAEELSAISNALKGLPRLPSIFGVTSR